MTHVQEDELARIENVDRRARIALIPRRIVATYGFVLGTSRLGFARLTDSDEIESIRRGNWDKHTRDALIAVTAAHESDVFVTEDRQLARRVREDLALEVWDWHRLVPELRRLDPGKPDH